MALWSPCDGVQEIRVPKAKIIKKTTKKEVNMKVEHGFLQVREVWYSRVLPSNAKQRWAFGTCLVCARGGGLKERRGETSIRNSQWLWI